MPFVGMEARVGLSAEEAVRRVADFETWPERSPDVESVAVERQDEVRSTSRWEVHFRRGLLRWLQRDELDLSEPVARFSLIEGDPVAFEGTWTADETVDGCVLRFGADFDLGIDTLAHVLDPLAVESLEKTLESVVRGVVDEDAEIEFSNDLDDEEELEEEAVGPRP